MATYKPFYGLIKLEYGDATTNNTPPVSQKELPFSKVDTPVYAKAEDSYNDLNIEEQDTTFFRLSSQTGARTYFVTSYCNDLSIKADLEGGTYTPAGGGNGAKYAPPKAAVPINKYLKVTMRNGKTIELFNAQVSFVENGITQKSGLPEWNITFTATSVDDGFETVIETEPVPTT